MGKRRAGLYLNRTHTNIRGARGRNSSVASRLSSVDTPTVDSRQPSDVEKAEEPAASVEKEIAITDYDIMKDNAPRVDATPAGLDSNELQKRQYVKTYRKSCQLMGVNPVQPITENLASSHIVLKTRGLGVNGAKAIAIALVDNQIVESVDLEDNWIGADGAKSICEMLYSNHYITELNIAENRIGTKGIRAIAELMATNEFIRKLDVSGSNLFDHDANYIASILENNYKLKELKVRHNKFGELGGLYLGPAIASNDTLEVLDLAWNHLRAKGAEAVAAGMQVNSGLHILDISWNGFAAESCKILGASLRVNSTLKELDISSNRLEAEAVGGLLKFLTANDTLSTLKIGNNPLTPDIATAILKAVDKADKCDIMDLDMENIVVEEEFMTLLEQVKRKRLLVCKTGPVIRRGQKIVKENEDKIWAYMDPVKALYEYINEKAYRIIDLFKRFDAEKSLTVTRDEFCKGLIGANVPMTVGQLEELVERLDTKKDGMVDLKELIDGEKIFRRKSFRKKLRRKSMEMSSRRKRSGSLPDILMEARRKSSVSNTAQDFVNELRRRSSIAKKVQAQRDHFILPSLGETQDQDEHE